jgi:hypothetical protein
VLCAPPRETLGAELRVLDRLRQIGPEVPGATDQSVDLLQREGELARDETNGHPLKEEIEDGVEGGALDLTHG